MPKRLALFVVLALAQLLLVARVARAACDGPAECCVATAKEATVPLPTRVRVGVRILRISNVSEREGSFHADVYVLTRWPAGAVAPKLVARNVVDTTNAVEDRLERHGDDCYHAVRIQDDFETPYLLHRFPFDDQRLRIVLEDFDYDPAVYSFDEDLWPLSISKEAYKDLTEWRFQHYPRATQRDSSARFHPGDVPARIVTIEVPVGRVWEFYMSRYFFPLILIVALSYSLFFVRHDDLSSSSGIGITAVLAIIAFQVAQAESMPHVAYLTLADKVYLTCYLFTAVALALTIHGSYIARHGREAAAERLQRRYRLLYPLAFLACFAGATVWGWRAGSHEIIVDTLQPPSPPAGEVNY